MNKPPALQSKAQGSALRRGPSEMRESVRTPRINSCLLEGSPPPFQSTKIHEYTVLAGPSSANQREMFRTTSRRRLLMPTRAFVDPQAIRKMYRRQYRPHTARVITSVMPALEPELRHYRFAITVSALPMRTERTSLVHMCSSCSFQANT